MARLTTTNWKTFVLFLGVMLAVLRAQPVRAEDPQPEANGATLASGSLKEETWTLLSTTVRNPLNEAREFLVVTSFDAASNVQFAVRVWVPAHSRRQVFQPVRLSQLAAPVPGATRAVNGEALVTLLLDPKSDPERQWSRQEGLILADRTGFAGSSLSLQTIQNVAKIGEAVSIDRPTWREAKSIARLNSVQQAALTSAFHGQEEAEIAAYLAWDEREAAQAPSPVDPAFKQIQQTFVRASGVSQSTFYLGDPDDTEAETAALGSRRAAHLTPSMSFIASQRLPNQLAGYDGYTNMVISARNPDLDPSQISALRQWLLAGGRLWIMADRVDPQFAQRLLGNDWMVQPVDRLDLQDFSFVDSRPGAARPPEKRQAEPAVEMVRVVSQRMEVVHTVNGWPASLRQRVGRGEVLVTTVGPRGWMENDTSRFAGTSLRDLAADFFEHTERSPVAPAVLATSAEQQVGRPTMGRGPVLAVLVTLLAGLAAAGFWAARRGHLEYATGVAIVLSLAATGVLIGMGATKQQSVPLTIATANITIVAPGQQMLASSGQQAIYSPVAAKGPLSASQGGLLWPDLAAQAGQLVRMVWTDRDNWEWQKLSLPQGALLRTSFFNVASIADAPRATGRFSADGLMLDYAPGATGPLQDVIVAGAAGRLAPDTRAATWIAGPSQMLRWNEYIAGSIDATRADHSQVYKGVLAGDDARMGAVATVMGWTTGIDPGFALPNQPEAQRRNSTMLMMPVSIAHATAGETVTVPSAFIGGEPVMRSTTGGSAYVPSIMYSIASHEWLSSNPGGTALVRFTLPPQVLPLRMTEQRLHFTIDAVGRNVEVVSEKGDDYRVLASFSNLSRATPQEVVLRGDQLVPSSNGTIILGLRVNEIANRDAGWQIVDIGLTVRGEALPPTGPEIVRLHPPRVVRNAFVPQNPTPTPTTRKAAPKPSPKEPRK